MHTDVLDLSASSWKGTVKGIESAQIAVATNNGNIVYSAIGNNLPDLRSDQTGTNGDDTLVATSAHPNLSGGSGNDILVAAASGSTLDGGAGTDIMFGGAGSDTFKFSASLGQTTILDMHSGQDVFEISHTIFADFAALVAHSTDDGHGNTVIATDATHSVTLNTVPLATLHATDFHFV
ncbi:MAG: M10 family metallopeptidase C-terminal domain-containing protein [Xanthobacteraceae bacterium]